MLGQGPLIQEADIDADGMGQEEFEQMQAALVASMADQEEIIMEDEDNEAAHGQQVAAGQGGFLNSMMGMFGFASQDQDDHKEDEEQKEEDDGR